MNPGRVAAALVSALLCVVAPAHPQTGGSDRIVVAPEPGTPIVAVEALLAAGPAGEAEGKEGITYLAARAATAPVMPVLDSLGARLSIRPQKDAVSITLAAAPDVWKEAADALLIALFRDPPQEAVVRRERQAIAGELLSRQSNPADAANREADGALYGRDHPWGRPTVGTPGSVNGITPADVEEYLRDSFTTDRIVIAVVGPVDAGEAREHVGRFVDGSGRLSVEVDAIRPERSPVRRSYDSITTWTVVSYRFSSVADLEAIRFLAQLALDELDFSPMRRSVFNAQADVHPRLPAGEIRFQVVTPPEEAEDWAGRILSVVDEVAHEPMLESRLEARLRRYRGERLNALAAPEDRARELARELLVYGETDGLLTQAEGLTLDRLRAVVGRLSAPIVLLLGPFQDDTG